MAATAAAHQLAPKVAVVQGASRGIGLGYAYYECCWSGASSLTAVLKESLQPHNSGSGSRFFSRLSCRKHSCTRPFECKYVCNPQTGMDLYLKLPKECGPKGFRSQPLLRLCAGALFAVCPHIVRAGSCDTCSRVRTRAWWRRAETQGMSAQSWSSWWARYVATGGGGREW